MNFGDELEVRPAIIRDLDSVADVWHESASQMDGASTEMPSRDELRQRIDQELATGWELHVATSGGIIIGMLALKPATATLDQLFVRPAEQGRGVGRALLDFAKRILPRFTLRTATSNTQGRRLYEREGLSLTKEGAHPRTGAPVCYYEWRPSKGMNESIFQRI